MTRPLESRSVVVRGIRALGAAVAFLTRVPVVGSATFTGVDLARGSVVFPIVGLGIGALTGIVAYLGARAMSHLVAATLAVAFGIALTGALHVDGLADTADGLGARSRTRALAVMRESSIGTYGAVALVVDIVLRVSAFDALEGDHRAITVATLAGGLSRCVPVASSALLPYARTDGGLGAALSHNAAARAITAVVLAIGTALLVAGVLGLEAALAMLVVLALTSVSTWRWLGGYTGDTLGAASEVCEVTVLVVAVALIGGR